MKFVYATGSRPLDGYTIKRGIGVGGFGEVYFATSDAGKEVALKRIQRNLDVEVRGVTHCLNLKHPNLLSLYDIRYDDQGEGWIVMEYISGESLKDVLDRHPQGLPLPEVDAWFDGLTAGVAYLHDHGIVHRDLKPGNIFSEEGVVKIGDYGLSKFISCSRRSGQTESVGTFHYMAPEIGKGVYGREIDIYALGIILFELLTGTVPFDGESSQEIIMKHLTATPDLSGVPQPYREVIRRALLKDPEQRFASVEEMRRALGRQLATCLAPATAAAGGNSSAIHRSSREAANEPLFISDDPPEMVFGPVRQVATDSPFGSGVPIVMATAVSDEEPIAKAVRGGLGSVVAWWRESAVSTPIKIVLLVAMAMLLFFNSQWLIPLAIVLGAVYMCYFGIRSLVLATSPVPAPANVQAPAATAARQLSRRPYSSKAPYWREVARQELKRKPTSEKLAEVSGSMLTSAVVAGVLCLIMMIVAGYRLDGNVDSWILFTWLSVSSALGAWLLLLLGKLWEGNDGEPIRRRFVMLVAGLALGAAVYGTTQYLTVATVAPEEMVVVSRHRMPDSMYSPDGTPMLAAYLAYFGALLVLLPWWKQMDPLRRTRFSPMAIGWCALWAWILNMFIPFPQPWGVLIAVVASAAVQLAAPWVSAAERADIRKLIRP